MKIKFSEGNKNLSAYLHLMNAWHMFRAKLNHFLKAKRGGHGVHSPFVFELATKVFPADKKDNFSDHPAEKWRRECLQNNEIINVTDFGTGKSGARKISDIAKLAAKSAEQGQLLYRIIRHLYPENMLELGTSLGITTLYEATATSFGKFITLEGCPEISEKAKNIFRKNNLNVEIRSGAFEKTLQAALQSLGKVDYVFFDGNHREEPTLNYFNACLPYTHKNSFFIFDDIHWSREMESAWNKIKAHSKVKLTIDVFHFGIVFFREENREKEHFVLKF